MPDHPPPQRLRDLVAEPRPFPLRTVVLIALVPLVGFTIFVIATHREAPLPPALAPPPAASPSGVIFVTPVRAAPIDSR